MTAISFRTGARVGSYVIEQQLPQSGPFAAYRGVDRRLGRTAVISVLEISPDDLAGLARFRHEARLLTAMRHPHILRAYSWGETDGSLYLVQESCSGPNLAQRLAERAGQGDLMPRDEALDMIEQIAAALDAAHARGLIHGSLRPELVLLNSAGQAVVSGFALRRAAPGGNGEAYLAPEQALGEQDLSPAVDIYALGILAFELITGQSPFRADQPGDLRFQQIYAMPPRPSSLRSDLPLALDRIILSALVKDPAARPVRAGALAALVSRIWAGRSPYKPRSLTHSLLESFRNMCR